MAPGWWMEAASTSCQGTLIPPSFGQNIITFIKHQHTEMHCWNGKFLKCLSSLVDDLISLQKVAPFVRKVGSLFNAGPQNSMFKVIKTEVIHFKASL